MTRKTCFWALVWLTLVPALAFAQQTGAISGKVTDSGGLVLPGVTVEAKSVSLPTPRMTVTGGAGEYRLPALQPGNYTITFTLSGMGTVTRQVLVQLAQDSPVDVSLSVQGVSETVTVTAEFVPVVEKDSTALKSAVSSEAIRSVPVGQEYRDLIKLIPGVTYTQDATRGPSVGGSGQDNVYKFDGVNVTLPLFGTLSAEPSSHDIAQVTTIKGGSKAVDFDRAGGFTVDSVSKSGTSSLSGMVSYQIQSDAMAAKLTSGSLSQYQQDRSWTTASLGGPILPNKAYFYGSYYRPTRSRANASNVYGSLPGYDSVRNEGFGKVTVTPISQMLINVSWRQSHRLDTGSTFGSTSTATTGAGNEAWQKIGIVEGSWVANARSFVTFKYTHFANPTQGRPDYEAALTPSTTIGTKLDINSLDQMGNVAIPTPVAGQTAYNAFIQPLIDKYGYVSNGVKTGGGTVGYSSQFNKQDFFRDQAQMAYNLTLGSSVQHDLHVGLQWYVDSEDLVRSSNGWGAITVPGGRLASAGVNGINAYYQATFQQMTTGAIKPIHSEYKSLNLEVNDTIKVGNFSFNAGLLMSQDKLYGQDLKNDASTISGLAPAASGTKYLMYTIPFGKTLQPRVGATWAYNSQDTVYASFARYTPAASSLPRAASWARGTLGLNINAFFDQNGVLYGSTAVGSSTGKMFEPDMTPRRTDEYLIGTAKNLGRGVTGRLYYRYRRGSHYWEDTNNDARVAYNPPSNIPRTLYIANAVDMMKQLGAASSVTNNTVYVIAELDGAYTKYHEVTAEAEWRTRKSYVRASYSWNRYRGNFDQDNTTTGNDDNIFIGSSNIGDGAGRQLWDFKDGIMRGDRPMSMKLYGYYQLPWWASIGAYAIVQSGQPWEKWSYEPYIALTTSTNESNRYAEPAGAHRTDTHYQLDLNYTQDFRMGKRYRFALIGDLFNLFNKQTGYNIESRFHQATYGTPRNYFDPRRVQITARFQF
jgi:hypothetical protein